MVKTFRRRGALDRLMKGLRRQAEAAWRKRSGLTPAQLWSLALGVVEPTAETTELLNCSPCSRHWLEEIRQAVGSHDQLRAVQRAVILSVAVRLLAQQRLARRSDARFADDNQDQQPLEFSSDDVSDREIVNKLFRRVQEDDEQVVFAKFVECYQKQLFLLLYAKCRNNADDAEDALQETLIQVFKQLKAKRFDPKQDGWAWTKRIAIHTAITLWRKRDRRDRSKTDWRENDGEAWDPVDGNAPRRPPVRSLPKTSSDSSGRWTGCRPNSKTPLSCSTWRETLVPRSRRFSTYRLRRSIRGSMRPARSCGSWLAT